MSEPAGFEWDVSLAEVIDEFPDAMGDPVKVGVLEVGLNGQKARAVLIGVRESPAILDTPGLRDHFARAWMEACRRADGEAPAAQAAGHG